MRGATPFYRGIRGAHQPLKLYLAAPWDHRIPGAQDAKRRLQEAGFIVNARWIDFHGTSETDEVKRREAQQDVDDIINSELLVVLQTKKSEGKAFEQGLAFALGRPILGVGVQGDGNVFQYLDDYRWVPDLESAVEFLEYYQLNGHAPKWESHA